MAALVADYGFSSSSGSDSEREQADNCEEQTGRSPKMQVQVPLSLSENHPSDSSASCAAAVIGGKNYLGVSDHQSSDEDSESDVENEVDEKTIQENTATTHERLPLPSDLLSSGRVRDEKNVSVFSNPFLEAEKAQLSVLEKHVRMTANQSELQQQKRFCWRFKKFGQCPFGKKCKYSHGSDNKSAALPNKASNNDGDGVSVPNAAPPSQPSPVAIPPPPPQHQTPYTQHQHCRKSWQPEDNDDDSEEMRLKKKRVGLAGGLVPPKRAMAAYQKQQEVEQPWISK